MALTNSLVLQAIFALTRVRGYIQRRFVRHWISVRSEVVARHAPEQNSPPGPEVAVDDVEQTLAQLTGRAAAAYAYDAPPAQYCALVSNATRAALEMLTAPRRQETNETESTSSAKCGVLIRVFASTAPNADLSRVVTPPQKEDDPAHMEAASRVLYHTERGIDSLQSALRAWWTRTSYVLAFVISIALLLLVQEESKRTGAQLPTTIITAELTPSGGTQRIARADTTTREPEPFRQSAPHIPWLLLGAVSGLAALVTPYTTRLLDRPIREG
jgi:hypothetical protein